MVSKEEFKKMWKNSTKDEILNQYYYDYQYQRKLANDINKAIDYIKQYGNLYCLKHTQFKYYNQYKVLLEILKGGEEEDE